MSFFFFFNDTPTTEIYTLSLHDALPIYVMRALLPQIILICYIIEFGEVLDDDCLHDGLASIALLDQTVIRVRSEEHTSELQSHSDLVCRLLLEKKKKQTKINTQ